MKNKSLVQYLLAFGVVATLSGHSQTAFAQTAVALDGSDDYVSLPSGTIPESNLTIAMWINPASLPPLPSGVVLAAWGPLSGCFPSGQYLNLFTDRVEIFTGCGEALRLDGPATLVVGGWQHVALTIDATGNDVLYFNGVQTVAGNSRGGTPVVAGNDVIGAAWVGNFLPPELHFHGAVDEVQIYNHVLSASEVGELYDAGKGHFGAVGGGLVAGYHFDEGSGTSAADFSGNGSTASLVNGVGWTPSPVAAEGLPFSVLSAHATLHLGPLDDDDTFRLRAAFSLNNDSNGIDPSTEEVRLQLGSYSASIPPGSFRSDANGPVEFEGVIEGVTLKLDFTPTAGRRGRSFTLTAHGKGARFDGTVLPVGLALHIGDDQGGTTLDSADVTARSRP